MSDATLTVQADVSWINAEKACFEYICNAVGYQAGVNAKLGDAVPEHQGNIFAFAINGGPDQVHNIGCPRPNKQFVADAFLIAQFKNRIDAQYFAGRLMDSLPAFGDPEMRTGRPGGSAIVLKPNVYVFELTYHPNLQSRVVEIAKGAENIVIEWQVLACQFKVVYGSHRLIEE